MPHVQTPQHSTPARRQSSSKAEIAQKSKPAMARDDLREAFAGNENKGPKKLLKSESHSTKLRSRKTEKSKSRTPVR